MRKIEFQSSALLWPAVTTSGDSKFTLTGTVRFGAMP